MVLDQGLNCIFQPHAGLVRHFKKCDIMVKFNFYEIQRNFSLDHFFRKVEVLKDHVIGCGTYVVDQLVLQWMNI